MKLLCLLLVVAVPALAQPADAPVAPDEPGTSVHLSTGQGAPFPGRLVSDPEHVRREGINTRNATFYADIVQGAVVVVAKATLYSLIAGGSGVTVALIGLIVGLFATHKL